MFVVAPYVGPTSPWNRFLPQSDLDFFNRHVLESLLFPARTMFVRSMLHRWVRSLCSAPIRFCFEPICVWPHDTIRSSGLLAGLPRRANVPSATWSVLNSPIRACQHMRSLPLGSRSHPTPPTLSLFHLVFQTALSRVVCFPWLRCQVRGYGPLVGYASGLCGRCCILAVGCSSPRWHVA